MPEKTLDEIAQGSQKSLDDIAQESQQKSLDDIAKESVTLQDPEDVAFAEALGGLRPDRLTLSFMRSAWQTVKGVPSLPRVFIQLTKESLRPRKIIREIGPFTDEEREQLKSQFPDEITDEVLDNIVEKNKKDIADDDEYMKERYPLLYAISQDYADRFGDWNSVKKTLKENPFDIISEALPLLSKLGKSGKLGKYSNIVEKTADVADPTNIIGTTSKGAKKSIEGVINKRSQKYKNTYNPEVGDTGKKVTEIGSEIGLEENDIPAMILSDNAKTRKREGLQYRSEDSDISSPVQERFNKSEAAIQDRGRQIGNFEDTPEGIDLESAGIELRTDFETVQDGFRGEFKRKFDDLQNVDFDGNPITDTIRQDSVMDTPIVESLSTEFREAVEAVQNMQREIVSPFFENTFEAIGKLHRTDSNLLPSSEYGKVIDILEGVWNNALENGFTIRDMDRMRTNFRRQLDIAVNNNEITLVGAGEVSTMIYAAMTQDFYNSLEKTVAEYPDRFDADFVLKLQDAKRDYADVQKLLDTEGVKYILRNQFKPTTMVTHILNKMPKEQIDNVRQFITPEAWSKLQTAFVSSILEKSLRGGEWSPAGLKRTLHTLEAGDKRLSYLFDDVQVQQLNELAEFSKIFEKRNFLTSDALNDAVNIKTMKELLTRIGNIAAPIAGGFMSTKTLMMLAGGSLVQYIGEKKFNDFINSPAGREWMTKGNWELKIPYQDQFIRITPQDLRRAAGNIARKSQYVARTTQRAEERQQEKIIPPTNRKTGRIQQPVQ